ncbi:unnamed protein product [Mytilus coruscus]|uniref:Uncharacterized protein n=1 Tax=Mytilus coruscus TaxID=42192 RepID=A0A6J8A9I6_MYTCO|nr:unnamed protein product [Mytilus coruscus]
MVSQTGKLMDIIDKSALHLKYKAWCYLHRILPRITWPLLMYEVPLTKVESLERMFNRHLRKWLGVPNSFSSIAVIHSHEYPCLTWEFHQDKLEFICRILRFSIPVSLFDSRGQWYATCTFTETTYDCTSVDRTDLIVVDYSRKTIVFATAKVDDMMNGIWVCSQDNLRLTTHVSLSKGIIVATEIFVKGTLSRTSSENAKHVLNCFSCREPDGNNVEVLVNGRTEDSITYSYDADKCTHHKGECSPKECSCDANEFTRSFPSEMKDVVISYSCDMLFTDPFSHAKFSVLSTVVYNGTEFSAKNTSISLIKVADKIWNERFTVDGEIEITTGKNLKTKVSYRTIPDIILSSKCYSLF